MKGKSWCSHWLRGAFCLHLRRFPLVCSDSLFQDDLRFSPLQIGMPCKRTIRCIRDRVRVRKILPLLIGTCSILGGGGKEPWVVTAADFCGISTFPMTHPNATNECQAAITVPEDLAIDSYKWWASSPACHWSCCLWKLRNTSCYPAFYHQWQWNWVSSPVLPQMARSLDFSCSRWVSNVEVRTWSVAWSLSEFLWASQLLCGTAWWCYMGDTVKREAKWKITALSSKTEEMTC